MPLDGDTRIVVPPYLAALLDDPTPALEGIALFMDSEMREAWTRRSFGGVPWPEQYPGQDDPFIHFAGALTDLKTSSSVKQRRFKRNLPLADTGLLRRSVRAQPISKDTVEAGVLGNVSYAGLHALPGNSTRISITETMRRNLTKARRRASGSKKKALSKLGFIYAVDVFEQDIAWRPFVGITARAQKSIPAIVQAVFENRPFETVAGV